ncbi:hypothetical protein C5P00_12070, partial [Escherichia coli]|uniref:hypothetical protein n=1 Tax=Escherichia coli TaxID=562 RepID=UPI000D4663FE
KGWAILLRQKQKKLIMLPSETMIWQPEFTDKTLSRKPGAVHSFYFHFTTQQMQNSSSKADHHLLTSNESSPGTALKHCRNKNNKTLIITDVRKISMTQKTKFK